MFILEFEIYRRLKEAVATIGRYLSHPLKYPIHAIERNYGRAVSTYFYYVKWLTIANILILMLVIVPFLALPHILFILHDSQDYNTCRNLTDFNVIDLLTASVRVQLIRLNSKV